MTPDLWVMNIAHTARKLYTVMKKFYTQLAKGDPIVATMVKPIQPLWLMN
jgi:hypothetical protein